MGKIIAICGIDGSGKTTCATIIKEYFEQLGQKAIILDSMKNGIFIDEMKNISAKKKGDIWNHYSAEIINLAWTMDLIYIYENIVRNYIDKGYHVILHRSELCCRVYSHLFGCNGNMIDNILDEYNIYYDLHLFLDINPGLARDRIIKRNYKMVTRKEKRENLFAAAKIYNEYLNHSRYKNTYRLSLGSEENTMQGIVRDIMNKELSDGNSKKTDNHSTL